MPRFPDNKNEILILAGRVAAGIGAHPGDYPNPPFDAGSLLAFASEATAIMGQRQSKEAEAKGLLEQEDAKMAEVTGELRRLIRIAEAIHRNDAAKLQEIDWDIHAQRKHLAPGAVRNLEAVHEGAGTVTLEWKAPARNASSGRTSAYKIAREIRALDTRQAIEEFGVWESITFKTKATLENQPRGAEIIYRVTASNRNGDSPPEQTQRLVL